MGSVFFDAENIDGQLGKTDWLNCKPLPGIE